MNRVLSSQQKRKRPASSGPSPTPAPVYSSAQRVEAGLVGRQDRLGPVRCPTCGTLLVDAAKNWQGEPEASTTPRATKPIEEQEEK